MSIVSIIGAGPLGASIAHRLAQRGRVAAVRVVDENATLAAGKMLDVVQAAPVERFDVPVTTSGDVLSAVSSPVIVVADDSAGGVWDGERGLALVRQLQRAGTKATFVFAAPSHVALMELSYRELGITADRIIGTAPGALAGAVRALAGLELGVSSVNLSVVGRPPAFVIGWSAATTDGSLLTERVPPHRLFAISQAVRRIWPSGPYAIASATTTVVEGLVCGARRRVPAATIVDGEFGVRGTAILLSLELGKHRVLSYLLPSLSPQERTEMISGLG